MTTSEALRPYAIVRSCPVSALCEQGSGTIAHEPKPPLSFLRSGHSHATEPDSRVGSARKLCRNRAYVNQHVDWFALHARL